MLCAADEDLDSVRCTIRDFLRADQSEFGWQSGVDTWLSSWDEEFSARLGAAGFVGMTIPTAYGGQGAGHLHRYVVTEELLLHGAPVAAHWIADRQIAPALISYGTEQQRQTLLPQIAAGRCFVSIGMSEDAAGSDLAAVQSRAVRTEGGWLLKGRKLWTSGAHRAHWIVVLVRTSPPDTENRHSGLSQFLVAPDSPGVSINPILQMSGEHHFNEVVFDDVFVADSNLLGEIGRGWQQVTAELSFERSGPERFLSTAPLIGGVLGALAGERGGPDAEAPVGHLLARLISLRQLSVSVAHSLATGEDARTLAALVKDLGTRFEQDSVEACAELLARACGQYEPELDRLLSDAHRHAPMFTLRGGTNEVLRGVVARGMGVR